MTKRSNQSKARQQFRKKLQRWGMDPEEIRLCVAQMRERQIAKEQGWLDIDAPLCTRAEYVYLLKKNLPTGNNNAAVLKLGDDYVHEDGSKFRPGWEDPLLKGVARATGHTAKAVKRGKTITKYQYDQEESNGSA